MTLRQFAISVFALIVLLGFAFGRSFAASSVQPASTAESCVRIHWIGTKRIFADTNSAELRSIWAMPESLKLQEQTFGKLCAAPWRFLRGQTNPASTNLLRPLLEDLVKEEFYIAIDQPAGTTNFPGEIVLAVHLDDQRARSWETNIAAALESLTGIPITNSSRDHWVLKKHHAPNLIEFARVGQWMVLGGAQNHNPLLDETLARIQSGQPPFARHATNWFEADINTPRVLANLGKGANFAAKLPRISLAAFGNAGSVHTTGELTFSGRDLILLDPWNIPTNLVDGDLTSFAAIRGLQSWLAKSELWSNLQSGPPPDQLYVWSLHSFPMETYFAAPSAAASNMVSRLSDFVLRGGDAWAATNGLAAFIRSTNFNGIRWRGVPYTMPFLSSLETNGQSYVLGGSFQFDPPLGHPPPDLVHEIQAHSNLVYYHWEITGPRIEQVIFLEQFARLVSDKAQLSIESAGLPWLKADMSQMGNCTTEITQIGPGRFSLNRSSAAGFTAAELNLIVDWLESPDFPFGLHTLFAPPGQ